MPTCEVHTMHFPRDLTTTVQTKDIVELRKAVHKINDLNLSEQLKIIERVLDKMQGRPLFPHDVMD